MNCGGSRDVSERRKFINGKTIGAMVRGRT